jgi:amino-acid N-acetyltransferase
VNATRKLRDEYPCVNLRPAREGDLPEIVELLDGEGQATDGVEERLRRFWVAEDRYLATRQPLLAGVAGLEVYGGTALLRSVAVAPEWRRSGLGRLLTERALEDAASAGARDVVLLTDTAGRRQAVDGRSVGACR